MPPTTYAGSLQTKNKTELKTIATALKLNSDGTKDELQSKIKRHLDAHQNELEDNPTFTGLYGRRRRGSEKPPSTIVERQPTLPSSRLAPVRDASPPRVKTARNKHHAIVVAMDPIAETPVKDLRVVSAMLKKSEPITPYPSNGRQQQPPTPSSYPPLPPSPEDSNRQSISAMVLSKPREVVKKIMQTEVKAPNESVKAFRGFLSNSRNLWSLTAVIELIYILAIVTQWQAVDVSDNFKVAYPIGLEDWTILAHWFIPSLLVPSIVGTLISFSPIKSESNKIEFDALTASIVRLAAEAVYPYERFPVKPSSALVGLKNVDVLGLRWRLVAAGAGVAFAFAEAITGAPKVIVQELKAYRTPLSISPSPSAKMISGGEEEEDEEEESSEEVD